MGIKWENLKIGKWYAVLETDCSTASEPWVTRAMAYDGHPHTILAISFPFVLVKTLRGHTATIDLRVTSLTTLTDTFVKTWQKQLEAEKPDAPWANSWGPATWNRPAQAQQPAKQKRRKKEKPDPNACPRCGGPMVQTMVIVANGWRFVCRECGFDKGLVPSG